MIPKAFSARPAGLALSLAALALTSGCAHFHNAMVRARAAERARLGDVTDIPVSQKLTAEALPPPEAAPPPPVAAPVPAPAPRPAVAARPAAPVPAPAPVVAAAPAPVAPPAPMPAPVPAPLSTPMPTPMPAPSRAEPPAAQAAAERATIVFTSRPATACRGCRALKLTVAPGGSVLIERGHWDQAGSNWHYQHDRDHVTVSAAQAYAARLAAYRPLGVRALSGAAACAGGDGALISVEWIAADRHDLLSLTQSCASGAPGPIAQALNEATARLGLEQVGRR